MPKLNAKQTATSARRLYTISFLTRASRVLGGLKRVTDSSAPGSQAKASLLIDVAAHSWVKKESSIPLFAKSFSSPKLRVDTTTTPPPPTSSLSAATFYHAPPSAILFYQTLIACAPSLSNSKVVGGWGGGTLYYPFSPMFVLTKSSVVVFSSTCDFFLYIYLNFHLI